MKQILLFAAVLVGSAAGLSRAHAQTAQPTVNWTGFYIGGHGGYQWSAVDLSWEYDLPGLGNGANLNTNGGMGGIHGGVQQQFGNLVLGVELSGDWANGEGSATGNGGLILESEGICPDFCFVASLNTTETVSSSIDSLFLAVGRAGYAWDNFLLYFKGGFASADVGSQVRLGGQLDFTGCIEGECESVVLISGQGSGATEKRHTGYALGAGFDWMVWRNISLGVDYTYVNLGAETHSGTLSGTISCDECSFDVSTPYKVNVDPNDIHYLNARLTLHFNGASP